MQFGYGLVSICIKNHPSLLTGGKGWYYYYCIFDYFGVFWASEQCVFGLMVCHSVNFSLSFSLQTTYYTSLSLCLLCPSLFHSFSQKCETETKFLNPYLFSSVFLCNYEIKDTFFLFASVDFSCFSHSFFRVVTIAFWNPYLHV